MVMKQIAEKYHFLQINTTPYGQRRSVTLYGKK